MFFLHSFWDGRTRRSLLVFGAVFLIACGALPEAEIPTAPDNAPVAELPELPESTPSGIGGNASPTPTPTATPEDGATPTPPPPPTPSPPPPPVSGTCRLASMPECGGPESQPGVYGCCREESTSNFASQVAQAQARVLTNRPDLFNNGRVIDDGAYTTAVAQELESMGYCATSGGPPDEVGIKTSNDYNEQYDVVLGSTQQPWTNHTVTCRPSRF
jgi:hypothetical protein